MNDLTFKKYCLTFLLVKEKKKPRKVCPLLCHERFRVHSQIQELMDLYGDPPMLKDLPLAISNVCAFDLQIRFLYPSLGDAETSLPSFKHAA